MSIRNSAKAVIINGDKILLDKCKLEEGEIFYTFPGGGQNQYETMEQAVIRECQEETGYTVKVDRFLALYEEIVSDEVERKNYPDYAHKIFHIFLCHLSNEAVKVPTEIDDNQISCEWIEINKISQLNFYPNYIKNKFIPLIEKDMIDYLGSTRV